MGQSLQSIDPTLAARIVEIADRDGPKAAFTALAQRLEHLKTEGQNLPPHLVTLKDRLALECCALSQGR